MLYCRIVWKTEDHLGSLIKSKVVGIQVERNLESTLEGRNAFSAMDQDHWGNERNRTLIFIRERKQVYCKEVLQNKFGDIRMLF